MMQIGIVHPSPHARLQTNVCAWPRVRTTLPRILLITCLGAVVCCTTPPLQETKTFQQSFTAVDTVGQPLLDDLAVAERLQRRKIAIASAKRVALGRPPLPGRENCNFPWEAIDSHTGFIAGMCAADAPYISMIGDPPQTEIFRRSLGLLGELAAALTSLADGTSAAAASAQVQQLVQNATGLAGELAGATGVGSAIAPAVSAIAQALAPLVNMATSAATARQERQVILDNQAKVSDLIKALRASAPAMFNPLIEQIRDQIDHEDNPQPAEAARVEAYRVLVSDYMRLLDRLNEAWDRLVVAAGQPSNPASLAALAAASGQITADAAIIRKSFATLRLGASAN